MQPETFVSLIRQVAQFAAVDDVISQLKMPSGRRPAAERVDRSNWFNALPREDQARIEALIAETALAATFGVLCVLDGSRTILHPHDKGRVELRFISPSETTLLTASDGSGSALHEFL